MNILRFIFHMIVLNNSVFLICFSILTIISLVIFKWLFNRKLNNNSVKHEGLIMSLNSLLLIVSMCVVALSGWYTILQHYV